MGRYISKIIRFKFNLIYFFLFLIIFLFIFIRFYNIKNSLFFFNDLGRDSLVLYNWQETGKIPLLGPQTSALPINQSPFYFYYLMIFYFLMKGNPIYSVVACSFFYIFVFIFGFVFFKKNDFLLKMWLWSFFFISLHPQQIIQNRYVWNPSFVSPLILFSILSFYSALVKDKKNFYWSSFFLAGAISFSYSAIPLLLVFLLYLLIFKKEYFFKFLISFFLSSLFFYLPIIIFELRHDFLLTKSLFTKSGPPQTHLDLLTKFNSLSNFIIATNRTLFDEFLLIFLFFYSNIQFINLYFSKNKKNFFYFIFSGLFILSMIIPIGVQAHYIFPILISFFLILYLINKSINKFLIFAIILFYFLPILNQNYFKNAIRTYNEVDECFKNFCQSFNQPIYVSVISSFHPYHYGPEHRYLLKKNKCQVYNIEENQNKSQFMLVVLDDYQFNQPIKYYELDLFGKYKILKKHYCQKNFGYVLLKKN